MRSLPLYLILALGVPTAAHAQAVVQPLPGSSDADLLAATMRRVAANPLDVEALATAGEQSLKVDDLSGAASLFARAERIDPRNGRVKAGMASILVRSERPGEALRYFQQAESAGLDPRRFAADRGLAYDLVGEQERAQRDYRLALRDARADETVRRYALSLGISGRRQEALQQLEPLLGRTDRAAWRARAFVLAMAGDQAEAARIATTMMPGGMAQGLRPFFERLPTLPAADRAFAVHFGEVRSTPERVADARLKPALVPLPVEPRPVVQVAAAAPPRPAERASPRRQREERRRRARPGRMAIPMDTASASPPAATVVSAPVQVAAVTPAASAPRPTARAITPAPRTAAPTPSVATGLARPTQPAPSQPASVQLAQARPANPIVPSGASASALPAPGFSTMPQRSTPAASTAIAGLPSGSQATPARTVAAVNAPPAAVVAASPAQSLPTVAAATTDVRPVTPAAPRGGADSVLARIVASLAIPASELGVAGPVRAVAPLSDPGARTQEAARAKAQRDAEAALLTDRLAAQRAQFAAGRKAAEDRKALADRKAATDKRVAAAREVAEERRIARTNPARIWVQVAGGASSGDLPKAYAATKARAPQLFTGRTGWTARLRATNRVLTGPFKTEAEARSFVNQLAKSGVSAFTFTSDPGEPVTRLPTK